jgi:hypothetical protein
MSPEELDQMMRASSAPVAIAPDRVERLIDNVFRQIDAGAGRPVVWRVRLDGLVRMIWPPRLAVVMAMAAMLGLAFGTWVSPDRVWPSSAMPDSETSFLPLGS